MMNNLHPIRDYIVPGKRAHLVGIGGVSMCPLAEVLRGMGLHVQGSDMTESDTVRHLRSLGIPVAIGHNAENLGDCDLVVRTAAVHDSNPEIAGAVARGIPVYERAQAWGAIMQRYPNALCVAGTHGKTTTTCLVRHILRQTLGVRVGLIGTIRNLIDETELETERTTPESCDVYRLLRQMADAGCRYGVMEVSSHALALERVWGCLLYTSDAADE